MEILKYFIKIRLANIILWFLILFTLGLSFWYFFISTNPNSKMGAVIGSLIAGLIVAIIQFLISYQDYTRNKIFNKLCIIKLFDNRNKKKEYYDYIATASHEIKIMGSTAIRFFQDFCVTDVSAPDEEKIIITKLCQGIRVKILLPSKQYLKVEKHNDYDSVKKKIAKIKKNYPRAALEVKYFEHTANHSIFMVDNSCIVGPIFPNRESRYTFSQQLRNVSELAKLYLDYFDEEWKLAHE